MAYIYTRKVLGIELETSTLSSLVCKDSNGNDFQGLSLKLYDPDGVEITDAANEGNCIKTVFDFEPTFGYALESGQFMTNTDITDDCYLYFVVAPDISAGLGGSIEFMGGINLKFVRSGSTFQQNVDPEISSNILRYDAVTHQSKSRIILKHAAGGKYPLHFIAVLKIEVEV